MAIINRDVLLPGGTVWRRPVWNLKDAMYQGKRTQHQLSSLDVVISVRRTSTQ